MIDLTEFLTRAQIAFALTIIAFAVVWAVFVKVDTSSKVDRKGSGR